MVVVVEDLIDEKKFSISANRTVTTKSVISSSNRLTDFAKSSTPEFFRPTEQGSFKLTASVGHRKTCSESLTIKIDN